MSKVLIIDDDRDLCQVLCDAVTHLGHEASFFNWLQDGVKEACSDSIDVVLLDVCLPDGNGLDEIPKISAAPSRPEIIIITGNADPDGAELAINSGVWDYIQKPVSIKNVVLTLNRALQYRKKKLAVSRRVLFKRDRIIGTSQPITDALAQLARAAGSDVGVLLTGETGTGKELFAHALHQNSLQAENNFVIVDCTALPETLVESVLFGHDKGAFTGAEKAREGLVKQAHLGTLFLDEVGEMPASLQKAFLRVLECKWFRPLGHKNEVYSNFRLVSATNRDLDEMVQQGRFRSDLLFRLRAFNIELPPLRKRGDDIIEIATHYINQRCKAYGMDPKGYSPDFFEALLIYGWPGNVRELVHAVSMALAAAREEPILFARHLPNYIRVQNIRQRTRKNTPPQPVSETPSGQYLSFAESTDFQNLATFKEYRKAVLADAEKTYLRKLIKAATGSIKKACRLSGLGRTRLYTLLKSHRIDRKF
jgi:two-component system, NtrC family, response regulator